MTDERLTIICRAPTSLLDDVTNDEISSMSDELRSLRSELAAAKAERDAWEANFNEQIDRAEVAERELAAMTAARDEAVKLCAKAMTGGHITREDTARMSEMCRETP